MSEFHIVWYDGIEFYKIEEVNDYYDAVISAAANYMIFKKPIAVISTKQQSIVYRIGF